MFNHRPFKESDAQIICRFPQSEEELFFMYPKAGFPLTPDVLLSEAKLRLYPTVATLDNELVGYGNFIPTADADSCHIGNIIVNPEYRKMGAGSYLMNSLCRIACEKLKAKMVKVSCFNVNTAGLLLYLKLGFGPMSMEARQKKSGEKIVVFVLHRYLELIE